MSDVKPPPTYRGKNIGILSLAAAQLLIGLIHVVFGFWLLSTFKVFPFTGDVSAPDIYSIYTVVFGLLTLIFSTGLWLIKRWGWAGTVAVAIFVTVADTFTLLDLPSIPGIPKSACYLEISYSLLILLYLLQPHIRTMFKIHACSNEQKNLITKKEGIIDLF